MRKIQVAVVGPGVLGTACANALIDEAELALAGIVRRQGSTALLRGRLARYPVAEHIRDLQTVDVALICVPPDAATGVARELLQARIPVVECVRLEGRALDEHYAELEGAAEHFRATAVVGAGWSPGMLDLFEGAFNMLIPRGQNMTHRHPGLNLHHGAAVREMQGVQEALVGEYRSVAGVPQRYVYIVMKRGADFERVKSGILSDPLFAGVETDVFQVDDLSEFAAEDAQGIVLERRATAAAGGHAAIVLEARFEVAEFAARAMLDAARTITELHHGVYRYGMGARPL